MVLAPTVNLQRSLRQGPGCRRPDLDQSDLIFVQLGLSAIMESSRAIEPTCPPGTSRCSSTAFEPTERYSYRYQPGH